jgi:hypothetical protein
MTHRNESGARRENPEATLRKMCAVYYTCGVIQGFAPSCAILPGRRWRSPVDPLAVARIRH